MAQRMVYSGSLDGSGPILKDVPVNINQTIVKGSLVVKTTGKASVIGDAPSAGTVWGVAYQAITTGGTVTAADVIKIDVNPMSVYEMPHNTTGSKTTLTASDIGSVFDCLNAYSADLDDTTGGVLELMGLVPNKPSRGNFSIKNRVQLT